MRIPLAAVILAAGAGTRMKSDKPKTLHEICGKPMILQVLDALRDIDVQWTTVVVGHGAAQVTEALREVRVHNERVHFAEQRIQRGTGDAVDSALNTLPQALSTDVDDAEVMVLPGDTPLLEASVLSALLAHHRASHAAATLLTVKPEIPTGYGRIVRDKNNRVREIVEERDATEEQRAIQEVNTSVYVFNTSLLGAALHKIDTKNAQGELYLTDVVKVLASAGHVVETYVCDNAMWAVGVNDRAQLSIAEMELRSRINEAWMRSGVTLVDPISTYIESDVRIAPDATILPNTRLCGATTVAKGACVGPNSHLNECTVGEDAHVDNTVATRCRIGARAKVGPFAVLQEGYDVADDATIGPFVECKSEHQEHRESREKSHAETDM